MKRIVVALMLVLLTAPSWASQPAVGLEGYQREDYQEVRGDRIPYYFVCLAFFETGVGWYLERGTFFEEFLREMGIEPASAAATATATAMVRAEPIIRLHAPVDLSLVDDPQAFERSQIEAMKARAGRLAVVFARLLVDLERAGFDRAELERYLEEVIRPQTTIYLVGESRQRMEKSDASLAALLQVEGFERRVEILTAAKDANR